MRFHALDATSKSASLGRTQFPRSLLGPGNGFIVIVNVRLGTRGPPGQELRRAHLNDVAGVIVVEGGLAVEFAARLVLRGRPRIGSIFFA